jgi:ADP-heptose:LPS heptosyltransferase
MSAAPHSLKTRAKRWVLPRIAAGLARRPRPAAAPIDPATINRVIVFQLGGLGDVLTTFPLLEAVGRAFPHAARLTLGNQGPAVYDLLPDTIPSFEHHRLDMQASYATKLRQLSALRRSHRADLVVSAVRGDGAWEGAVMARLLGARWRVGFDQAGSGAFLTHSIPLAPDRWLGDQHVHLLGAIGLPTTPARLRIRTRPEAEREVDAWLQARNLPPRSWIAVHPWAKHNPTFREWPDAHLLRWLTMLHAQLDAHIILMGGPDERPRAQRLLAQAALPRVHILGGELSLAASAALIGRSALYVGVDSVLLHLAYAQDVPTVALFGATPPAQVIQPGARVQVVDSGPLPCRPCYAHQAFFDYHCIPGGFPCLHRIAPERVLREVESRWKESRP